MGLAGLTAVFGMGTGVAPPVWSPGKRPSGGGASTVAGDGSVGGDVEPCRRPLDIPGPLRASDRCVDPRIQGGLNLRFVAGDGAGPVVAEWVFRGGGSGWSSRLAVRTGRLRRSLALHSRPIDLVIFQEPSQQKC